MGGLGIAYIVVSISRIWFFTWVCAKTFAGFQSQVEKGNLGHDTRCLVMSHATTGAFWDHITAVCVVSNSAESIGILFFVF